jgi:DNA-binding transcriptional MerR regulator
LHAKRENAMQLKDLSQQAGVSTASIKYYLREGLLPPGEAVHATRARYTQKHIRRLEVILALRHIVHLNIEQIRIILALADDGAPRLELLATVQREVLGLGTRDGSKGAERTQLGDAVVRMRDWPDSPSDARAALNAQIARMESLRIPLPLDLLDAYSKAMDSIATVDLRLTTATDDADEIILTAAVGMDLHSQLLLKLLALAQASHAIRRFEGTA